MIALIFVATFLARDTWRYKMTVVVDTPEGIKTGSAVREVARHRAINLTPESAPAVTLRGEAVTVNMDDRGILFALLKGADGNHDYGSGVILNVFPELLNTYLHEGDDIQRRKILSPEQYPMMVRFKDLNNQKSIEPVYTRRESPGINHVNIKIEKEKLKDAFDENFGAGFELKEISIELTNDPVTWGIESLLPWLPDRKNIPGTLGGDPRTPFIDPTGLNLTGIEFSKGRFW